MTTQDERAYQKTLLVQQCIGWKLTGFSLDDRDGFKMISVGFKNADTGESRSFRMSWMSPAVDLVEF